jgi:hypothetical protein
MKTGTRTIMFWRRGDICVFKDHRRAKEHLATHPATISSDAVADDMLSDEEDRMEIDDVLSSTSHATVKEEDVSDIEDSIAEDPRTPPPMARNAGLKATEAKTDYVWQHGWKTMEHGWPHWGCAYCKSTLHTT